MVLAAAAREKGLDLRRRGFPQSAVEASEFVIASDYSSISAGVHATARDRCCCMI